MIAEPTTQTGPETEDQQERAHYAGWLYTYANPNDLPPAETPYELPTDLLPPVNDLAYKLYSSLILSWGTASTIRRVAERLWDVPIIPQHLAGPHAWAAHFEWERQQAWFQTSMDAQADVTREARETAEVVATEARLWWERSIRAEEAGFYLADLVRGLAQTLVVRSFTVPQPGTKVYRDAADTFLRWADRIQNTGLTGDWRQLHDRLEQTLAGLRA